jgi:solute carrier family 25, member 39/40
MMSIPMVGIYLPLYDYLLEGAQQQGVGAAAPLVAGTLARTVAVYCTAPFELIRTRIQAVQTPSISPAGYGVASAASSGKTGSFSSFSGGGNGGASTSGRLLRHLPMLDKTSKTRALRSLWTGVGATLARDVPFSGLYWAMVEPIRKNLLPPEGATSEMEVMMANVAAGGISGGLSGAITTPLDVVKTRTQLQMGTEHPVLRTLANILETEGAAGLFSGWSARAAKAAPACAIVLSAYEMLKFYH